MMVLYTLYYSDTEAVFLDLNLTVHSGIIAIKMTLTLTLYFVFASKQWRSTYCITGVYISQSFFRTSGNVSNYNDCNKLLSANFVKQ